MWQLQFELTIFILARVNFCDNCFVVCTQSFVTPRTFCNTVRFARCLELNSRLFQPFVSSTIILRTSFAIPITIILLSRHLQRQIMLNLARVLRPSHSPNSTKNTRTAARTFHRHQRGHIIFTPRLILHKPQEILILNS